MSDSFELDLDGDGVADATGFDGDGDGYAETIVSVDAAGQTILIADTDGNGVYDTTGIDASGDGSFETIGVDADEDGTIDEIAIDTDGDGIADELTSAGSGAGTTTDDLPGTTDPADGTGAPTGVSEEGFDVDGDGVVDRVVREIDIDGDGTAEVVDILADRDGNGQMDAEVLVIDEDGDGDADTVIIDGDLDGVAEATIYDRDGNDVADTATHDFDEDGEVDAAEFDLDEDGNIDMVAVPGETLTLDESGHVIDVEPNAGESGEGDTGDGGDGGDGGDTGPDENDPVTPEDPVTPVDDGGAPDDVTGEPLIDSDAEMAEDSQRWFKQSENGFCAPASVAFIVGEYTDAPIDEATFVDKAVEMGFLTETSEGWSGMTVDQTATLLEEFGVEATVETGTVDSLDTYLDHGYNAIVAIDSDDIWYGGEANPNADGLDTANHAVVVSEIKDGYVYLLDPGTPDGNLERVPVEVFEQAWSASGHEMVLTDNPDVDDSPATTDGGLDATDADRLSAGAPSVGGASAGESPFASESWVEKAATAPGTLFIPVVIAGAAVRAWTNRNH